MNIDKLIKASKRINKYTELIADASKRIKDINANLKLESERMHPFLFVSKEWYINEINKNYKLIEYMANRINKIELI